MPKRGNSSSSPSSLGKAKAAKTSTTPTKSIDYDLLAAALLKQSNYTLLMRQPIDSSSVSPLNLSTGTTSPTDVDCHVSLPKHRSDQTTPSTSTDPQPTTNCSNNNANSEPIPETMDVSGKKQTCSNDIKTVFCCNPCLLTNKNAKAEHYCKECDEFFCSNCSSVHKMFKLSRKHTLLSVDEISRQKITSLEDSICSKHSGETYQYFCRVHKDLCCRDCANLDHKNCGITPIDSTDAVHHANLKTELLNEKIQRLLRQLNGIKESSTRNSQDIQTIYTRFLSDVNTFRSQIDRILDSIVITTLREAQDAKDFDVRDVESVSTTCNTVTNDINEISTKLDKHSKLQNKQQFVISATKAETKIHECEKKIGAVCRQYKIKNYRFHQNEGILDILQSAHSIGTLVDTEKEAEESRLTEIRDGFLSQLRRLLRLDPKR